MISGTIYDPQTGEISRSVYAPMKEDIDIQCSGQEAVIYEYVNGGTHYIKNGQAVARPAMPLLSVSSNRVSLMENVVITGVCPGTTVAAPNYYGFVEDDTIEWNSNVPGHFQMEFYLFPYLPMVIHVEVTDKRPDGPDNSQP